MSNKVVRSICFFTDKLEDKTFDSLNRIERILLENDFTVQTKRVCAPKEDFNSLAAKLPENVIGSLGSLTVEKVLNNFSDFEANDVFFNIKLTDNPVTELDVEPLFRLLSSNASRTFNFTYVFNNPYSSPFMPSAKYERNGFAIGMQATDLSEESHSIEEWLAKFSYALDEINNIFKDNLDFIGLDSSIAPLFKGKSSFVNILNTMGKGLISSLTSDTLVKITNYIKANNPNPVGLNGMMLPALEDFELAKEYEAGNFPIERNIFASLHSGLGIDTYPIGIDESKERIIEILNLIRHLSNKYKKPLSARFVSDGKAKIGDFTNFQNQYLQDVTVRPI